MAVKIRLTDKLVRDLEPPATGNRIAYDTNLTGLGARITAAGARSFILAYRFEGRERRMTLGTFLSADAKPGARPIWSVAAARKRVIEERRKIDRGIDPLAEREEKRDAATVRQLIRRFLDEHVAHLRPFEGLLHPLIFVSLSLPRPPCAVLPLNEGKDPLGQFRERAKGTIWVLSVAGGRGDNHVSVYQKVHPAASPFPSAWVRLLDQAHFFL